MHSKHGGPAKDEPGFCANAGVDARPMDSKKPAPLIHNKVDGGAGFLMDRHRGFALCQPTPHT
jgi:hypothetical protein